MSSAQKEQQLQYKQDTAVFGCLLSLQLSILGGNKPPLWREAVVMECKPTLYYYPVKMYVM